MASTRHHHVPPSRAQTGSARQWLPGLVYFGTFGDIYMREIMTLIASMEIIISIVLCFLIRVNSAKDTLHLGVLISQEGDLDLSGYIPAMELALESIKNDASLPFDLDVTLNDSMVRVIM